jgi:ribosomal protein S18 acetylase RimI-like enzyme
MGAYAVLFYLVATQVFGSWTPLDVPYTDLYATPLPFLGPLQGGLLPAITEELTFRLVGVSLLLWLTRRRWLALLVPGGLWAFAHLSYVRDPFYLRGIELLISAVFLVGLFFLRFDLTTTIAAHFVYNAGLGALPLLRSDEPYFVISGLIVIAAMLAPVVPGMLIAARRRLRLSGEKQAISSLQIRQVTSADRARLAAFPIQGPDWETLLEGSTEPRAERDGSTELAEVKELAEVGSRAAAVCLQADDDLVGVAAGRVSDDGIGQVLAVYVAPRWRRRYWGSTLVDRLSADLRALGAQTMRAEVEAGDRVALAFWASQGWRPAVKVFTHSLIPPQRLGWRDMIKRWMTPKRG